MRPLQHFRKCSTLCHEGRRLKIALKLWPPIQDAEKEDFVMGGNFSQGKFMEIMEQNHWNSTYVWKNHLFMGLEPAIRRRSELVYTGLHLWGHSRHHRSAIAKAMNQRLSHRPGGQRVPRVCCEIRMRLYLKMGYTMVYGGYRYTPQKKRLCSWGRIR